MCTYELHRTCLKYNTGKGYSEIPLKIFLLFSLYHQNPIVLPLLFRERKQFIQTTTSMKNNNPKGHKITTIYEVDEKTQEKGRLLYAKCYFTIKELSHFNGAEIALQRLKQEFIDEMERKK